MAKIKASQKNKQPQKADTNVQQAILDIASNLTKSFKKYSKSTREKAWKRITSPDGEKQIKKILVNPERQLNTFPQLAFKEWMQIESNQNS
jgi:hypothetical protein